VFEELERELVVQALARTRGNQTRAAKLLGMTRDQIRYRIRKFSLAFPENAEPVDASESGPRAGDGDGR
jgi:transcriptional regulator with GAF, ATPase, and Fis domain